MVALKCEVWVELGFWDLLKLVCEGLGNVSVFLGSMLLVLGVS